MIARMLWGMALAAAAAPVSAADNRIRTLFYDPGAVVRIEARADTQSTVEFGPDERIENVAIGDSSTWQVTPNRRASLLFLKPLPRARRTNMTVVTDRRTYLFDLAAARGGAVPLYVLRFDYPAPPPEPPAPAGEAEKPLLAALPPAPSPTELNFAWKPAGTRRLLPARMFDDGAALYLAWPEGAELPAMLSVGPGGSEGPVNYTTKSGYIVIDGVPDRLVLRSGRDTATLDRLAPAPSVPAGTRTAER